MSVGSKSEAGSHRSASSSSNKGRDNPSGWTKWRASQWDSLRKHVSAQRRQHIQQQHQQHAQHAQVAPHDPGDANHDTLLLHTVSSDMVALTKLSDHIKRLKKELLQLKQWEETRLANLQAGQPPPPPLPFLMNLSSSTDTPAPSDSKKGKHRRIPSTEYDPWRHHPNPSSENSESPNSSDETTKQGSVNEKIEEKKRQLKAAQDAERLRRRDMARMMASTAERVKQDQRRRVQKLAEYERELARREQERIRSRESRFDATPTGASNKSAPSSAQNSPFHDLHGDYFSHIPTASASASSAAADSAREIQFRNAWSRYAVGWARITGKLPSPANEQFTFTTFPWPTVEPPKAPADLTKVTISEFILHPPAEFHASTKTALHEAVRRWHPDRSNSVWIHGIVAEEESALVKKGADIVIRVLNQLSADEKETQTP